jgi:hypothetical protein
MIETVINRCNMNTADQYKLLTLLMGLSPQELGRTAVAPPTATSNSSVYPKSNRITEQPGYFNNFNVYRQYPQFLGDAWTDLLREALGGQKIR